MGDKHRRAEAPPTCTSQYKGGGPTVKGIQRVWFGDGGKRGSIFGFLSWLLLGIYLARMISYPKEVING